MNKPAVPGKNGMNQHFLQKKRGCFHRVRTLFQRNVTRSVCRFSETCSQQQLPSFVYFVVDKDALGYQKAEDTQTRIVSELFFPDFLAKFPHLNLVLRVRASQTRCRVMLGYFSALCNLRNVLVVSGEL